jgi:hypothetical protein
MSQFDERSQTQYIGKIRVFLNMKCADFRAIIDAASKGNRIERHARPSVAVIETLESRVNAKAARCEASDTSFAERYCIARDYRGLSDAAVAKDLGLSREACRKWKIGRNLPMNMAALAGFLNVPLDWLVAGGETCLPANSHLGVRLGQEALKYRETLYGATLSLLTELDDGASVQETQVFIDHAVMSRQALSELARRAGGRWQLVQGQFEFAPWVCLVDVEPDLTRRLWTDEVEAMISEELASKPTVYAAWQSLARRCSEMGTEFPQKISLYKRLERLRKLKDKFGVYVPCQCKHLLGN